MRKRRSVCSTACNHICFVASLFAMKREKLPLGNFSFQAFLLSALCAARATWFLSVVLMLCSWCHDNSHLDNCHPHICYQKTPT